MSLQNKLISGFSGAAMAVTGALASLPATTSDAYAAEPQTASTPGERGLDAVQGRDDMAAYSKNPNIQGIGIFINLQANAAGKGHILGKKLQRGFAGLNPPIQTQYRINQSRGTATDVTFYVRGVDYTFNLAELKANLGTVLARHNGAWLPERVSSASQLQPVQQ